MPPSGRLPFSLWIVAFMDSILRPGGTRSYGQASKLGHAGFYTVARSGYRRACALAIVSAMAEQATPLRRVAPLRPITPGPAYTLVKWISWIELIVFAGLLFFWLAPGFEHETFIFGLAHGIGYLTLCAVIWAAVLRHEAPYYLLAATLTPVGPVGSVIAIEFIDRKRRRELAAAA